MSRTSTRGFAALGAGVFAALLFAARAVVPTAASAVTLPDPVVDQPVAAPAGQQTIVLAGGCFWGVPAVFYTSEAQHKIVDAYIGQLKAAKVFKEPIVTQVAPLRGFHEAEAYHQNYYNLHPNQPYIVINDRPKVEALRKEFASLWKA